MEKIVNFFIGDVYLVTLTEDVRHYINRNCPTHFEYPLTLNIEKFETKYYMSPRVVYCWKPSIHSKTLEWLIENKIAFKNETECLAHEFIKM